MNKVILIGNVCKDAEIHETSNGVKRANFTLAVNRAHVNAQGNREADFIPIIAWRERAEFAQKWLTRGKKICVVGTLQTRNYETQDGAKRTATEVVAEEIEFVTAKTDEKPIAEKPAKEAPQEMIPADDEELPF